MGWGCCRQDLVSFLFFLWWRITNLFSLHFFPTGTDSDYLCTCIRKRRADRINTVAIGENTFPPQMEVVHLYIFVEFRYNIFPHFFVYKVYTLQVLSLNQFKCPNRRVAKVHLAKLTSISTGFHLKYTATHLIGICSTIYAPHTCSRGYFIFVPSFWAPGRFWVTALQNT